MGADDGRMQCVVLTLMPDFYMTLRSVEARDIYSLNWFLNPL